MPHLGTLKQLTIACGVKGQVIAYGSAPEDASRDFNLHPKEAIYDFVAEGLESPTFINQNPWENDPDKTNPATVYAFSFYSGKKFGYIAFMKSNQTGKWLIKSFKKNDREDPKALPTKENLIELKKKLEAK